MKRLSKDIVAKTMLLIHSLVQRTHKREGPVFVCQHCIELAQWPLQVAGLKIYQVRAHDRIIERLSKSPCLKKNPWRIDCLWSQANDTEIDGI